jgi:hypothetical protein
VKVFWILAGVALIATAMHDVFHTLFHPAGRGALSDLLSRRIWRVFRALGRRNRSILTLGGPVIFLAIVASWALMILFGFGLIYWAGLSSFAVAPGMDPSRPRAFLDAFNISLGSLITIAEDFNANSRILRLLMGVEAVIGFGLLTASVSWLLSIYPVLEQRRSLAHRSTLLHAAEEKSETSIFEIPCEQLFALLLAITEEVTTLRNSMSQFPVSYYFHGGESETALPGILEYVRGIAERSAKSEHTAVRIAGAMLSGAIIDYLELLAEVYLRMPTDDIKAVLREYARDQLRDVVEYKPQDKVLGEKKRIA